jgi:hypothetical protein
VSPAQHPRPIAVTIIGCLYILTGVLGFAFHLSDFKAPPRLEYDIVWVELLRIIAIVCGIYLLRGSNWGRWLAIAWIAYHVVLSAFHSWLQLVVHCLLCTAFAYFLFRPKATEYFRPSP